MCRARAGHVAASVAARRRMIRPEKRVLIIPVVDRSNNSPFILSRLVLLQWSALINKNQETDTHLARAREQRRRFIKGLPAVAVICFSWCRAVGFIRAGVGLRVCCWAVQCCVRAGHVAAAVDARRHDTSRRTRVIPVVDRSNNSPFHIIAFGAVGLFIILCVLGLQIQIGSKQFL